MTLTAKQERFVGEYLLDLNATQAAIRAGYSEKTAAAVGHENLRKPKIAARIEEARAKRAETTEVTANRVLKELSRIGMSDVRKLFTDDGQLRAIHELDDDTAAALASVEVITKRLPGNGEEPPEVEYVHKMKFWDKNSALDKIGKHLGMFIERHEHTGAGGGPIQTVTTAMTPQEAAEAYAATLHSDKG
jgi:phage terminase small subunit